MTYSGGSLIGNSGKFKTAVTETVPTDGIIAPSSNSGDCEPILALNESAELLQF